MTHVRVNLAKLRRERGIGAAELARQAGISRQTVYGMESGSYVPNTAVALRLARVLDVPVEAIFSIEGDLAPALEDRAVVLQGDCAAGAAVQLGRVGGRLIAVPANYELVFLPATDGILGGPAGRSGTRPVNLAHAIDDSARVIVAGCDPAISLLARAALRAGVELIAAPSNSSQALAWLRRGRVHVAGSHLLGPGRAEANVAAVRRAFPQGGVAVITLAEWEEGFVTAPRNPKGIRSAADLARSGVRLMNRELGSGSRRLLDAQLQGAGIPPDAVIGYSREAPGHLPAARAVHEGEADCCIATRAAANAFGLHFEPLRTERYDFAVPEQFLTLPSVTRFFETLARLDVRRELSALACYDIRHTGERVM